MLAFVRLNRNKNVYRRTTKQPIIIDVEVSDDSFSHQEEKAEKIKHHSTPGPAQRSRTTQILTPINQSVSQLDDHCQSIISVHSDHSKPNHSVHQSPSPSPPPHRQPKLTDDSPLQFNQRGTSKPISTNHLNPNKPRHKVIFVRTLPHSPVVLIPRIPKKTVIIDIQQQQDSPISQQKTILPITKQYATSTLPAIPREVRGRMSMVTGSARRSRFLDLLPQSHHPPSSPMNTQRQSDPQTPLRQLIIPSKLSSHLSPVVISRSPFANQRRPTHKDINNSNNHGIPSLLKICNQSTVLNFTTTIKTIDRNKTVMGESRLSSNLRTTKVGKGTWEKIGEATYSEVFCWSPPLTKQQIGRDKGSQVSSLLESKIVVKIIPIKRLVKKSYLQNQTTTTTTTSTTNSNGNESLSNGICNQTSENEFPLETDYLDAEKEIKLNQLLGTKSIEGFIDFKGQLYCCLLFGHAGKDLEASSLNGWQQAASILEQATSALSQVEEEYEFEHRDLHWGNLLIQSTEPQSPSQPQSQLPPLRQTSRIVHNDPKSRVKNVDDDLGELANSMQGVSLARKLTSTMKDPLKPGMSGVRVSLIDYGLSRAKIVKEKPCSHYPKNKIRGTNTALIDHEILWTDPDLDIFGAIGNDYQFECYDLINLTREDKGWDEFNPISNLIWLHYLTKKLIDEKSIAKPPSRTTSSAPTRTITKTAQKERRQTSSSTRVRKTTTAANQKLKSSTAGNIRAREGFEDDDDQGSENHKNEEEKEQKLKIERDCYELLILSQRFLDHVIQHKVQLIHQRAKHSTNENNKKSRSSSDGSSLEEDKERNERLAIFREVLTTKTHSVVAQNKQGDVVDMPKKAPQNHNKAEAKSLDTQYATVNQALLDKLPIQIASSTKIKQKNHLNLRGEENNNNNLVSFTAFFLDWFRAYKAYSLQS
ncbi:hypothetical protein KEM48_005229 [Puccinia striiformis f. sp. tritici PST-130]|nr:hypothetical protein KEM48_005229 [Puccinia striiformis f. sp. tritici PST-130]